MNTVTKLKSLAIFATLVGASFCCGQTPLGKYVPSEASPGDNVGDMVEIEGDLAVAGAWYENGAEGAAYVYRRVNGVWQQEARLHNPDGTPFTLFGVDVAVTRHPVYGEFIVVGAVFDLGADDPDAWTGSAYVFRNTGGGWDLGTRLARPDEKHIDFFGFTVAASRDLIVVGSPADEAPGAASGSGTAYIYRFDGSQFVLERADYVDPDAATSVGCQFAEDVSVYSNGTDEFFGACTLSGGVGTAYITRNVGGIWQRDTGGRIQIPDPTVTDRFAFPTVVNGRWVAIAAPGHDGVSPLSPFDPLTNSGAVYMYRFENGAWTYRQKIEAPDRESGDRLGAQLVDVSGDFMVIGTTRDDANAGASYLYRFDGTQWLFQAKLRADDTVAGDEFGICAIDLGQIIVGAWFDDNERGIDAGAVYFYDAFNSPGGANVSVQPVDRATGEAPATLTFSSIVSPGTTTVKILDQGPPPPAGFKLGTPGIFYEISTTSVFAGQVAVCLRWEEGAYSDENALRLFHYENGAWADVTSSLDTVNNIICGTVTSLSPFVIVEPEPVLEVSIDIKPGSFPNTINLGSNGNVPVAILSSATFDARTIDPLTVTLASAAVNLRGNGLPQYSFDDVNGDSLPDLVVHVGTQALRLTPYDVQAVLEGRTFGGQKIGGVDTVRIVP